MFEWKVFPPFNCLVIEFLYIHFYSKDIPLRRVKRWSFSIQELLRDPVGRAEFTKFLEKEYSVENLKFWEAIQDMKSLPQCQISKAAHSIWNEFLTEDAPCSVNIDSKSLELTREALNINSANDCNGGGNGGSVGTAITRWCFDVAEAHVYHLMKSDSYSRYLRSDMYKEYFNGSKKKSRQIPNLFGVKRQLTS